MIKKLFKENILVVVFLSFLALYGLHTEDNGVLTMSFHLSMAGIISSFVSTTIFFMIPARYATIAFGAMFAAIGIKFIIFSGFFGYGLYNTSQELIPMYILSGLAVIFLYKGSLLFFIKEQNK